MLFISWHTDFYGLCLRWHHCHLPGDSSWFLQLCFSLGQLPNELSFATTVSEETELQNREEVFNHFQLLCSKLLQPKSRPFVGCCSPVAENCFVESSWGQLAVLHASRSLGRNIDMKTAQGHLRHGVPCRGDSLKKLLQRGWGFQKSSHTFLQIAKIIQVDLVPKTPGEWGGGLATCHVFFPYPNKIKSNQLTDDNMHFPNSN